MSPEDQQELFRNSLPDVTPIEKTSRVALKRTPEKTPGIINRRRAALSSNDIIEDGFDSREFIKPVKPMDILSFKRDGVQHGVFKKLRLGKYPIESRIDLHRLTFNQARDQLSAFIKDCTQLEIRCALITHGKGEYRDPPALLKSCVNHWLQQTPSVLAFHSAQPQHGSSGSTYVLFQKGATKKADNRERFGSRS